MNGIRRVESEAKRRRVEIEGENSPAVNQGNERGSGGRVIPSLPEVKGHQSVGNQIKAMGRVEQSAGYQQAQNRWTGQYYAQEFPEFQPYRQQGQVHDLQYQHHQSHQPPQFNQQQYVHQQNFPAQFPLRGRGEEFNRPGEEFNLYTNMDRNDRSWPYNSNRGRWN